MKPEFRINNSLPVLGAFIFFLLIAVFIAGYLFSQNQLEKTTLEAEDKLEAASHLKEAQIAQWLRERMGDGRVIKESSITSQLFQDFIIHPDTAAAQKLTEWMNSRLNSYNYENIFFFDASHKLRLEAGNDEEDGFGNEFFYLLNKADSTGRVVFSGLYKTSEKGNYDIDFLVPLSPVVKNGRRPGFIVLRSDPENFLYPVLTKNLFYKSSAQSILMQNLPGVMEVFNPAKNIYGNAASIPLVISRKGGAAADTVFQEEDQTGEQVIKVIHRVTGSSWYLVSSVNRAEVYAPVERQRTFIIVIAGLIVIGASVAAGLIWHSRQSLLYRTLYQEQLEKEKINRELIKAEKKFKGLIENNLDVIVLLDAQGNILYESPSIKRVLGYSQDERTGKHSFGLLHPDEVSYVAGLLEELLSVPGKHINIVVRIRHKDGSWRSIELDAQNLLEDESINAIVLNYRDVTERIEAENRIKELNSSLERKVRERTYELEAANKELEAFAYSVSHDLRSPLRSIDGFSQALFEDYAPRLDEEGLNYLTRVRAATQRMGKLIDDILSLSRITRKELDISEVNLSEMVRSITDELLKISPERKVELIIQDGLLAKGDKGLLQAALGNLLENAFKFTSRIEKAKIEFGCSKADGKSICFVKDNGAGFDMKYADKLFSPFQRLHTVEEFPGTGIGLANVQKVIRRHGGNIWVESEKDRGAAFYFTLYDKYTREHEEKSYTFS